MKANKIIEFIKADLEKDNPIPSATMTQLKLSIHLEEIWINMEKEGV